MCTASVSVAELNHRLSEPSAFYSTSSPSSISELGQSSHCHAEACDRKESKTVHATEHADQLSSLGAITVSAGDSSITLPAVGDWTVSRSAGLGDINADVTTALSISSTPHKRRWSDVAEDEDECLTSEKSVKRVQLGGGQDVKPVPPDSQEDQARSTSESVTGSSWDQSTGTADDYDDDVCYSPALDLDCSERHYSRRTLYIEYWSRTDECKERKWDHLDEIAEKYGSAEEHIFATTLNGRTACLEPNMFPYNTPAGIEHWTLWHVQDLTHEQIKQYVENWIDANAPHVQRWNYDDNPERSIDIFHVHVYLQVGDSDSVLQDRKVEDLMHECD